MLVRQAIVSTPNSRALKLNELVSRTDHIDDELGHLLCKWCPGRDELAYGRSQSINFFQPERGTFAIARSFLGELDSNLDGGRRIISHVLLFDRDQLSGYNNNIALVAHVLRSQGSMLFQPNPPERIAMLDVPENPLVEMGEISCSDFSGETEKVVHAIEIHQKVVILGLNNPLAFLRSFLADLPISDRLRFSFATGLEVINGRRFSLQFFPKEDPGLLQELASRQLRTISLGSNQPASKKSLSGAV